MKATLNTYRQSPRKVRLIANLIRGKNASRALALLKFTNKRASEPVLKLLSSAVANAKENDNIRLNDLIINNITVNDGATLKRFMPRARGRASRINKRTSHITITLKKIDDETKFVSNDAKVAQAIKQDVKVDKNANKTDKQDLAISNNK